MDKYLSYFAIKISFLSCKCVCFLILLPSLAFAQIFGSAEDANNQETYPQTGKVLNEPFQSDFFMPANKDDASETGADQKQNGLSNVQIKPVISASPQNLEKQDNSYILLYMRDFKIDKTFSNSVSCSMKFYVYSGFPTRISNLSYRLKWPKMETPLSFDDIKPNDILYQEYALLGEGCYSMDHTPNVIVNRCRVKDMTQNTCASKIHWVR